MGLSEIENHNEITFCKETASEKQYVFFSNTCRWLVKAKQRQK